MKNKYCQLDDLGNESDVEQFLLLPILNELGYSSPFLRTKSSIGSANIGKGKNKKSYVPDYLVYTSHKKDKPVLVVDAKHPREPAEAGVEDAQLYASVLRRKMATPKPDQYCIGTNGHLFIVKHFESDEALLEMAFAEFVDGHPKLQKLHSIVSREALKRRKSTRQEKDDLFAFRSVAPVELPAIFEACHRAIWKSEKRSPASAFYEFAKSA